MMLSVNTTIAPRLPRNLLVVVVIIVLICSIHHNNNVTASSSSSASSHWTSTTTTSFTPKVVMWQPQQQQPHGLQLHPRSAFANHHQQQRRHRPATTTQPQRQGGGNFLVDVALQLRGGGRTTTTTADASSPPPALLEQQQGVEPLVSSLEDTNATTSSPFLVDVGSMKMDEIWTYFNYSTSSMDGLSSDEAQVRLQYYGPNTLEKAPTKSLLQLIFQQFEDKLVQILVVVALVSAIFSMAEVMASSSSQHHHHDGAIWKAFVEPIVIVAILICNAIVGVLQSQSATKSLAALQELQATTCTVIRDNSQQLTINADTLVPGDLVQLSPGDKVPADGRLISLSSSVFAVDEGSLTGESITVYKLPGDEGCTILPNSPISDQRGMVYAGTIVTQGSAVMIVSHTGMSTQFGSIQAGVIQAEPPKTPLQIKLEEFGHSLTILIGLICVGVWIVSIPKMNDPSFSSTLDGAIYYAKVAVALGVAAIPEGLPAVITLCLSLGTRRMAQRNVIVRSLPSVETLGCTSVICTDKTGTLTTNEMTVVSLVVLEQAKKKSSGSSINVCEHEVEGYSYSPMGAIDGIPYNQEVHDSPSGAVADIAAVSALCNNARIVGNDNDSSHVDDSIEETVDAAGNTVFTTTTTYSKAKKKAATGSEKQQKPYERVGEPTEAALCVLAEKLGGMSHYLDGAHHADRQGLHLNVPPSVLASANVNAWRESNPRLATLEFSRDRKSMSVLCAISNGGRPKTAGRRPRKFSGNRLFVKGAPNLLLERCTHIKYRDGTVARMTGPIRREIEHKISEMAMRPLRCIALAVKDSHRLEDSIRKFAPKDDREVARHPLLSDATNYRSIESGLTLVGVVGIKDPARPGVADSINLCAKAGIRVMMITGDSKDTAIAIARDVNIFPPKTVGSDNDNDDIKAFEGREFFLKPEPEQLEILKEGNIVFCRAEPADKQKLIKMLQSLNEVTCMTGDGVNDAPALQQASIGVAMGITGTEVSKEAADMVLADDNFSTIVSAVEEGRRIYNNMQAFICFLISCNIGEICAIFLATLAGFPEPLTAMHLLWVNLVTDGPPATALGFNPPAPNLMEAPPRPSDEPIMTRWLLTRYCITGLYVGIATIGVFAQHYVRQGITLTQLGTWSQCGSLWAPLDGGGSCSDLFQGSGRMLPQTLALTTLVCMEMLKALSAVSVDTSIFRVGPQDNKWLLLGVSGPILLHLLVVYSSRLGIPGLGESFGLVPLTFDNWITVMCWALPILLVDEVLKAIGRWIYREERAERAQQKIQ